MGGEYKNIDYYKMHYFTILLLCLLKQVPLRNGLRWLLPKWDLKSFNRKPFLMGAFSKTGGLKTKGAIDRCVRQPCLKPSRIN